MGLFRFITGVLGILLTVGAFLSFFPLFLIGGIASGSVAFAFGFPIFLMIVGAAMVYYGFYHGGSVSKSNIQITQIAKWGLIHSIAVFLANYIINRFVILDNFLIIIFTALLVSIITQVVRSHDSNFNLSWFVFYFLVYANTIWTFQEFIVPKIFFQTNIYSILLLGFILAGIIGIIQKLNIKRHSLPWISTVLLLVLLATNLESVISLTHAESLGIIKINPSINQNLNDSELSESERSCPTPNVPRIGLLKSESALQSNQIGGTISSLVDTSVWKIENNGKKCYIGKWKGQHPDWYYCEGLIVSRWETTSSGTINYKWHTAVIAEWKPEDGKYAFYDFSCENGQKTTADKEITQYYVHVERDGTEIKVEY